MRKPAQRHNPDYCSGPHPLFEESSMDNLRSKSKPYFKLRAHPHATGVPLVRAGALRRV